MSKSKINYLSQYFIAYSFQGNGSMKFYINLFHTYTHIYNYNNIEKTKTYFLHFPQIHYLNIIIKLFFTHQPMRNSGVISHVATMIL